MQARRTRVIRRESDAERWELAIREPDVRLRPYVVDYMDYFEATDGPTRRREIPIDHVSLILNLGPPLMLLDARDPDAAGERGAQFVAGLHDSYALYEHGGEMWGVEVRLTPLGAYRLLGIPQYELANRAVPLGDVLGGEGRRVTERLLAAPTRDVRFRILDTMLGRRLEDGPLPCASVDWAWRRLSETHGRVAIGSLTDELGCSRRHLATRFREQIGLPPKTVARMLRFRRAVSILKEAEPPRWAEIAYGCGYYDQAHFNRDFKQFAGSTPTEFVGHPEVTVV